MNEPKDIAPDLPEEEELPFDEPPAPAADPIGEDEEAPDLPEEPVEDAVPYLEPEPVSEPEPEPDSEPVSEPALEVAPAAEPASEPVPEIDDDHADLFEELPADTAIQPAEIEPDPPEADAPAEVVVTEAAPEPDPFHDLHGPEPWDDAPVAPRAETLRLVEDDHPLIAEPAAAPAIGPESVAARAAPEGADAPYEVKRSAFAVYLAYLTALMGVGLPLLPFACWWAYQQRRDAPQWLQSHYTFQIRTFWTVLGGIGLAGLVLFLPFGLFPLTIVATAIWLVMRCFVGLVRLNRGEPIFHPQTWTV